MISGSYFKSLLLLWNLLTYQCETIFKRIECCSNNSIYQIDKDRVIVGGYNTFYILNIGKYVIEKTIIDISLGTVNCFLKLRDNNTILCGCSNKTFCLYDMDTGQYKTSLDNHKDYFITDFLRIDDNTFIS